MFAPHSTTATWSKRKMRVLHVHLGEVELWKIDLDRVHAWHCNISPKFPEGEDTFPGKVLSLD